MESSYDRIRCAEGQDQILIVSVKGDNMPKCHLCNNEYEDGANYCAQCGARLDDREATAIPTSI